MLSYKRRIASVAASVPYAMADELTEKLERLYERLGIPEPWRALCLARFQAGRDAYGPWNHLRMSKAELEREFREEVADVLNFAAAIHWSRAYHSSYAAGHWVSIEDDDEDADAALDLDLIEAVLEVCRLLDARDVCTQTVSAPRG